MKFLRTASVFLFSSLFATGLAAPAPAAEVGSDLAISNIQKRCDGCDEIGNLVTVVKSFTAQINITVSGYEGIEISKEAKKTIIVEIQGHCKSIIEAILITCKKIAAFEAAFKLAIEDLKFVVSCCIEIFVEVCSTFLHCMAVLKCSMLELLGSYFFEMLNCFLTFFGTVTKCFENFKAEFEEAIKEVIHIIIEVFPGFCTCWFN